MGGVFVSFAPAYSSAFDVLAVETPPGPPAIDGPLSAYAVQLTPNISWRHYRLQEWLTQRGVPYGPDASKEDLLKLAVATL